MKKKYNNVENVMKIIGDIGTAISSIASIIESIISRGFRAKLDVDGKLFKFKKK